MGFAGVVEPRLVADLLVYADLAGHGLASYCLGTAEVSSVQDRWVVLAVTTGSTTRDGAPQQAPWSSKTYLTQFSSDLRLRLLLSCKCPRHHYSDTS